MPRKKFLPDAVFPYHITARCTNKEWFKLPMEEVWRIFSQYLYFVHHAYNLQIHSFVLMHNHFHLIVSTPDANLNEGMNYFMRESSKVISFECGRINQIFGGPYYWSLMKSPNYFLHAYKYVYRNPVEAKMCMRVEEYPFSTLHSLLGLSHSIIPLISDDTLFPDFEDQLKWLNAGYPSPEIKQDIFKALSKKEFRFPKDKDRKPHPLESQIV